MIGDILQIFEIAQQERDDDVEERTRKRSIRRIRDCSNPLEEYDSTQFLHRFRISKDSFCELLIILGDDMERPTKRSQSLSASLQLAITLRFYASGSFQTVIGDTCGVSQASCCRVIHFVTQCICEHKRHFIKFPIRPDEVTDIMVGFHYIAGFPGVVGAIDGCHVRIANPGVSNSLRFMNRKGFYSLNCQLLVVCDHNMNFTNIVARWYGSAHDSRIFEESSLCRKMRFCFVIPLTPARNTC